ncbi:amino acid adenylation domain-containing protein [Streptomyces sp. NPDC004539]|uniref:amino acid adenylation domain-containing protein n=1 Tax=Streptomyces sp. NPDC004539 TaxID=3154280 RepID=UPI0033BA9E7D
MLESQAAKTPEANAVVYGSTVLTYRELNARANRLARLLISRGARPEERVALVLPRSARTVVAILGVAKSGAAWVPVDPEYPRSRITALLDSARPLLVLCVRETAGRLPDGARALVLDESGTADALAGFADDDVTDEERAVPLLVDHAAYVIHTSGSTGAPKGVVVPHRGLAALAADHIGRFGIRPGDGVLQFASFNFDCSVGDLVMALGSGAALVVRPADCLSGHQLGELIRRARVTHTTVPPQVLAALPHADHPSLRSIATAGDVLPADLVSLWAPGRRMFNAYGPTEATVDALVTEVVPGPSAPPIGKPVLNTRVYVLDAALDPVPPGTEGELFIAGDGLARGYRGQPGLTADRFLPCPFGGPGDRMYRTGDVVRERPDGNLEFLGRVDEQVKIRGFRIEPGEIETVLNGHPHVSAALVTAREDRPGAKRLVAYVVPADGADPDPAQVRRYLAERLPGHLVPSAVVTLDAFPLNANGKLDRRALPSPDLSALSSGRAPSTPREEVLCALFAEVLGLDAVGIDDRFFDLGGDSVLAIRLAANARRAGWALEPADVFARQRVVELAPSLEPVAGDGDPDDADDAEGPLPRTPASAGALASWQSAAIEIPAGRSPELLARALQAVVDHHGALRSRWDIAEGHWDAAVLPPGAVDMTAAVVAAGDGVRTAIEDAAAGLDPAKAVVLRAVWCGTPRRLALVASRLVVDRVSWDVLLADLETAWASLQAGEPVTLAPAGTSYRHWARHLADGHQETEPYGDGAGLPARTLTIRLPREVSGPLLTSVPEAFRALPRDMALTGLALAVAEQRARRGRRADGAVAVGLEDDGRTGSAPGADLARTVGSLARVHPAALDAGPAPWAEVRAGGDCVGEAVKRVKEQVRSARGGPPLPAADSAPRIGFRHHDAPLPAEFGGDLMTPGHALDIGSALSGPPDARQLATTWTWLPDRIATHAVEELAVLWTEAMEGVAAHGTRPGAGGRTPSDLSLLSLSQDEIDDLVSEWE